MTPRMARAEIEELCGKPIPLERLPEYMSWLSPGSRNRQRNLSSLAEGIGEVAGVGDLMLAGPRLSKGIPELRRRI